MPTSYIRKLSKQGKGSVAELERKWDAAKAQASKQGQSDNYGYITQIFKRMVGVELNAAARLMARPSTYEAEATITIKGNADVVARVKALLFTMGWASSVGHSGFFGADIDGDGADRLYIEGLDKAEEKEYAKLANALSGYGGHVEGIGGAGNRAYCLDNNPDGSYLKRTDIYPEEDEE